MGRLRAQVRLRLWRRLRFVLCVRWWASAWARVVFEWGAPGLLPQLWKLIEVDQTVAIRVVATE